MHTVTCAIRREVDVYLAIGRGRDIAMAIGFGDIDRTRIEIIILELTRNLLAHAGGGELQLAPISSDTRQGIAITARDSGPGIPDIELAMRDGYSTAQTLGAGLPGVRRLADEFAISSEVGVGTTIRAVKWLSQRQRGQSGTTHNE
ncbi:anti-sigma regulatory factor [Kouleothrix aurantiaca]|jgi:serine/threonine-protein kinase RsbT|uniref:Anti-sigma regulatory factor n=1 Tax=Kouleothrix aurantiaca TaxID=186479 RepID=A0A0P9CX58_9CHLR|nr:anti-sigma regulatory factor [Kouleothrix aurantiaca]